MEVFENQKDKVITSKTSATIAPCFSFSTLMNPSINVLNFYWLNTPALFSMYHE